MSARTMSRLSSLTLRPKLDEKSDRCIVRFSDGAERPLSATWVLQKCIGA